MPASRRNRLVVVFGIAALLIAAGLVLAPRSSVPAAAGGPPPNLFALMAPFILMFVGIILAFIGLIILMTTMLNGNVSEKIYHPVEQLLIACIILGIVGMIQPLTAELFKYGFLLLLLATILYIAWSHIVPRGESELREPGTVSATELEQREAISGK